MPVKVRYARSAGVACVPPAVQVLADLDPEQDLELFVDYRDYSGESVPVKAAPKGLFEVREIIPAEVDLVVP